MNEIKKKILKILDEELGLFAAIIPSAIDIKVGSVGLKFSEYHPALNKSHNLKDWYKSRYKTVIKRIEELEELK